VSALPTYVPANLKALIETLDNATAEQVADLVRCYYSQRAAAALENFNQSNHTITVSKTINLIRFQGYFRTYLRANGMLQYARGRPRTSQAHLILPKF
jgi:hypothetical protein